MIAQTPIVIVSETVIAGLIVAFVTWAIRTIAKQGSSPLPTPAAETTEPHSPVAAVGDNATNSPVAVGAVVHQSNVYHAPVAAQATTASDHDSRPTPEEVSAYFRDLNPYQQTQDADHHKGIRVHWRLESGA